MHQRSVSLAVVHDVSLEKDLSFVFEMSDFSSSRFSSLYLRLPLDSNVKFHMFDLTDMYFHLEDCIDKVVKLININGGFTITGWYKKGEINDISTEEIVNNVEGSEFSYHIISIKPRCDVIFGLKDYEDARFDIDNIGE